MEAVNPPISVATIIVTFNRKYLLQRCLDSVLGQTHAVSCVFIIDNASTDGTPEVLCEKGYLNNSRIKYIQLSENTGGAGGFYEGMRRAYEAGYDWLWLMDDDGFCAGNCLAELLDKSTDLDVIGSAVVTPENPEQLSWSLRVINDSGYFRPRSYIKTYTNLKIHASNGIYQGAANFFNAILFSRKVVERIGLVNQELFIWGDDYEYFLRCKAASLRIGTSVSALYFHPEKLSRVNKLKYYYFIRNLYYTYCQYGNIIYHPFLRVIYPVYVIFRWLHMLPSVHPIYLFNLIKAIASAARGRLIPYPNSD